MSLPRITPPDPKDLVAVKRVNNTMAARKSRQRQIDHLEKLERGVEELSAERNHWRNWAEIVQKNTRLRFPLWVAAETTPVDPVEELLAMAR
jgi:hypothetical protein